MNDYGSLIVKCLECRCTGDVEDVSTALLNGQPPMPTSSACRRDGECECHQDTASHR